MRTSSWTCVSIAAALLFAGPGRLEAGTITVPSGGNLQAAIDAAQAGDTILLTAGAEYVGNFVLRAKSGQGYIVIRSSTPDSMLPGAGRRITPADAPRLARLRSPNSLSAILTEPGAHHWRLRYLEFAANAQGASEIIRLGDGSSAQNSLSLVPHHFILDHVYIHGDPLDGQKRGIAANVAHFELRDSHISDIKAVAQDTQAVGAWNGPGPFLIENNYLEAAGENVMFGGAYPYIPNLIADGIVIRRNLFSRPMAWMNPIVNAPSSVKATATSGGSLPAGTYAYRVIARRPAGPTQTARSTPSAEVSATVRSGGAVSIQWQAVAGATEYWVYGRSAGRQSMYWRVTGTQHVDTGRAGTASAVPTTAGTSWTIKNLFELKSARNVLVEGNIFQNHWKQAQAGFAIVYTPRSSGGCSWCTVENVTFQYNVVRNVAAGINILGYDNTAPTGQANNLVFRHNLFYAVKRALGGNGWFMQIGDGPRDIIVEHNTIDSEGTAVVAVYGGTSTNPTEVYGFSMRDNAARHGAYGVTGAYFSYGLGILTNFYPGYVFLSNYLAGAPISRYPAGTLVNGLFDDQFTDPVNGNYRVRSDSTLYRGATDGTDVGVDYAGLMAAITGVANGVLALPATSNNAPAATFSFNCSGLTCSFADQSTDNDGSIASRRWDFGDGRSSTLKDPAHSFAAAGTYNVKLTVTDDDGAATSMTRSITLTVKASAVSTVHIGDLDGAWSPDGTKWRARVTISVHSSAEKAVPGSTVQYYWTWGTFLTCTTNTLGQCTVQSPALSTSAGSAILTVRAITSSAGSYDRTSNHDVDRGSNGTAIKVYRR